VTDDLALSVVVPCRNERHHIEACVHSLLAQSPVAGGFEVLVVDGMSDDGTREVLARLAAGNPQVRLVDNPGRITPCAMNAGIAVARGRYIAIAGAHNRYSSDYLSQSVAVLEETGADNVGGVMICEGHSRIQRAVGAAHHSRFGGGGARWHDASYEGAADTVFGGVYRRDVFTRIGVFDTELVRNQDDEFNLRLTRAGGRIWQTRRVRSWYSPRASMRALFRQYFQYGYWKVRVITKHRLPASVRHVVPAAFVAALMGLPLAALLWTPAGWAWLAIVGLYALCCLVASVGAVRGADRDLIPVLPLVFATYHFGYGAGFLVGIRDAVLTRRVPAKAFDAITR
jgi:glycosyltransferase involved in cell wall biosynthesis